MKLQVKREAWKKMNRRANEAVLVQFCYRLDQNGDLEWQS